uniref:G-protein coupled receptors family 2 profile 2 domain-containing protein n=1 Tax=Arion vulgaris TaxID=1028688 RepID=A0A0B6ZU41_9EUPU
MEDMMDVYNNSCLKASQVNYDLHCPPFHDGIFCWPATLINTTAYHNCSETIRLLADKHCLHNGQWDEFTNYFLCDEEAENSTHDHNAIATRNAMNLLYIMFTGCSISLVVLVISLIIFQRLKSLQCPRTSIHKHLIASFILRFLIVFVSFEPFVFDHAKWYRSENWMCRSLVTLEQFSYLANFFWMLVEGLYLHLILVLRPLNNDRVPFLWYYFIGWVIPLVIAVAWAIVMHFEHHDPCWRGHSKLIYIYIIYAPIMCALVVNLMILVNLVRIIVVKICNKQTTGQSKICRTIKSTFILVILLGIINLLFFTKDSVDHETVKIYRYMSAVLPTFQGIFVAVIYCGMNTEVRRAIRKRWSRFLDSRTINGSVNKGRSSRTSATTFISRPRQCNNSEPVVMEMKPLNDINAVGDTALT